MNFMQKSMEFLTYPCKLKMRICSLGLWKTVVQENCEKNRLLSLQRIWHFGEFVCSVTEECVWRTDLIQRKPYFNQTSSFININWTTWASHSTDTLSPKRIQFVCRRHYGWKMRTRHLESAYSASKGIAAGFSDSQRMIFGYQVENLRVHTLSIAIGMLLF